MIRTVVKLACVALIANATWHLFGAVAPHYKFKDRVQYAALYRGDSSDEELREKILSLAAQFELPVAQGDVVVTRNVERHTLVDIAYVRPVELAPGFTYPLPLTIHIDAFSARPVTADESIPK